MQLYSACECGEKWRIDDRKEQAKRMQHSRSYAKVPGHKPLGVVDENGKIIRPPFKERPKEARYPTYQERRESKLKKRAEAEEQKKVGAIKETPPPSEQAKIEPEGISKSEPPKAAKPKKPSPSPNPVIKVPSSPPKVDSITDLKVEKPEVDTEPPPPDKPVGKGRAARRDGDERKPLLKGKIVVEEFIVDDRLRLLYDLARIRFPQYQVTIGEFIWDVVFSYFKEHKEELGMDLLFPELKGAVK